MTDTQKLQAAFYCFAMAAVVALFGWFFSGCGSWQTKAAHTLDSVSLLGKRARQVAEKVCEPTLQQCIKDKTNPCPPLDKCQRGRTKALKALHSLQTTILLGYIAIQTADELKTAQIIKAALQTWGLIQEGVQVWMSQDS